MEKTFLFIGLITLCGVVNQSIANPVLIPGTWVNITPPAVPTGTNETCIGQGVAIDPTDPNTIYWCTTPYNSSYGGHQIRFNYKQ